jgi:DNA-binding transcriptional LysR family regulator
LTLVERDGRRLRLTPSGAELAGVIQGAVERFQVIDDAIQELQRGDTGTVRVLANSTPASYILPPVLDRFLKDHPRATVQLQSSGGEGADVWRRFLREGYDLVLGLQEPRTPKEFPTEWLYDDELLFVMSRCFPLADSGNSPEMLAEATVFVGFTEQRWAVTSQQLREQGVAASRHVEVHSQIAIKDLVHRGAGVGLLFRSAVRAELASGEFVEVRAITPRRVPCWLAIRPRSRPDALVDGFVGLLRDEARAKAVEASNERP